MVNIAIIGAGNLGSRHLQGVLLCPVPLRIFVSDPNTNSIEIARQRSAQVDNKNHQLEYCSAINMLPDSLDVVIIATNSDVRSLVVSQLLAHAKVKYLILEKVLFPTLDEYGMVSELIDKNKVKAWVNHPRRMFPVYSDMKKEISTNQKFNEISIVGQNWGIGSNTLHFLDLLCYISGAAVEEIDLSDLDKLVIETKRAGYSEFTGVVKGKLSDGMIFSIASMASETGEFKPISVQYTSEDARILVHEGPKTSKVSITSGNSFVPDHKEYDPLFQSHLSGGIVADLLKEGSCALTPYLDAKKTHKKFIKALLEFYSNLKNERIEKCPIT